MTQTKLHRREPTVTVLGGGSWGTTVASIAARNVPTIQWMRDAEVAEAINTTHQNPKYLAGHDLTQSLTATTDLEHAVCTADVIVMAVPSQHYRQILEDISPYLRPWVPIVSLVKGLEQGTRLRMSEVTNQVLPGHPVGVLAGPNIAKEIVQGFAAAATIALPDHGQAIRLQRLFNSARFRVYTSEDVIGVEVAGAMKNVFAIAAGFGDGLGAGDNTRAMVITRSLRELTRIGVAIGGDAETFIGLAGMGDLIVTCTSPFSRNRHVGVELGKGVKLPDIIAEMNQVAEGVKAAASVIAIADEYGVSLPIATEVDQVINHGQPVAESYRGLLRSAPGHEVYGSAW